MSTFPLYQRDSQISNINKVLKCVKIIRILSSYLVGNSIWNHNPQFVTLKKLHIKFKKNLKSGKSSFYKGKKALTAF
jgi:hypothetical protein